MKKLLITGGSHAELPLILSAKELGWYVITTGTNKDGLGHKDADEYVYGDFSDKEFIYTLAKKQKVDAVLSGCNDFAYLSAAYACEKLGLGGHDSYKNSEIIHNKDKFRMLTESIGIKTPKVFQCSALYELISITERINFPVLLKPVDLTGGKGISVCNSKEDLESAFKVAMSVTRKTYVIIEEFVRGTNHGASFLLKNQTVVFSVFDDEQYYENKYLVQGASMPSDSVSQAAIFTLVNDVEKIARKLNLTDGLFHVQFIIDETGYPVMIDPCRRAPGDLYVLLAKYTTGIDYPKEIVKAETRCELQDAYRCEHNYVARECIMADGNGIVKNVYVSDEIKKYVIHQMLWGKIGDKISDFMKYKAGILIMKFPDYETMQQKLTDFHQLVKIETE